MKDEDPIAPPHETPDTDAAPPIETGDDFSPAVALHAPEDASASAPPQSAIGGYGAKLRAARERMGMLPADIAATLHLEEPVVRAIEQGREDKLPAAVYVRGYIRAYAGLVGLDADELVADFAPVADDPVPAPKPLLGAVDRKNLADLPHRRAGLLFSGIVLVIVIAFAATLWAIANSFDWAFSADPVAEPEPAWRNELRPPAPAPNPAPAAQEEETLASSPPATADSGPDAVAEPAEEQDPVLADLEFSFRENSWVEVRDGNGQSLHGAVGVAGQTLDISGTGPFTISIGYAAGVELRHKGEVVALGPHTQDGVARLELH